MPKSVLVISTLDTKSQETLYLKDKLSGIGLKPVLMDISGRGSDAAEIDIPAARVAEAGDGRFEEIQASRDRTRMTNIMMAGGSRIARQLSAEGKLKGVIGIGGSTGSLMATEIMRSLPFGIPKMMISSTAALPGLSTRYIGTGDIALFHSVVEISGVSDLLRNVMDRAAYALAGMVSDEVTSAKTSKGKAIALTMLGPCEKCASTVRVALEEKGFQIIGFSAAGIGDRAMENMIAEGFFQGVIDLAPGGVGEHLFGFMRDAGPHRLETAGKMGIPQIISTCSVNHMTPARSKYKPEYYERRKFDLDKLRTWIRLSPDELAEVAVVFADKLNRAAGPVTVVIPLNGWSSADLPGNETFDPKEDLIFNQVLREKLKAEIEIIEIPANMEDTKFAAAVVENALKIF
ncbi:MAG: Tm-1-like ATP-binding domain-containing protein [Desulfobacterales bacterium]